MSLIMVGRSSSHSVDAALSSTASRSCALYGFKNGMIFFINSFMSH